MKKMTLVSALFFLFIFIFSLPVSYAQTGKITGYVLDKQIGAPIIGANVVIEGTERGAATGIDGDFVILTVQPGTYTLKASAVGYSSVKIKDVVVSIDSTITIKFVLESGPGHFENCAVTYKNPLVDITLSSKVERITSESLDSYPSDDAYGALYGSLAYLGLPKNFNTEEFSHLTLNSWQAVNTQPLSTFSVDVDNASYTIMRQSVSNSMLPPPESVRIEEYINYFNYNYEAPTDEKPFSLTMEQSECPWNKNHGMLLIGIKGKEIDISEAPPSNFVFLIDNSGSMDHPNKSPLLKKGMKLLVNELRPVDRVSIVTYAGNPGLVLPSTPGNEKESISRALDSFRPGGFTGGAAGIKLAYKIAKENFVEGGNNRVILATDGDFNVGLSSVGSLEKLIEEKRQDGVFLTVLGFGRENLKDNKMEALADKGNGAYYYVDNIYEAKKVLVNEFSGLYTIAKDVKLQLEFNPAFVEKYRLIGYENRLLNTEDFADDKKDAGEIGAGHSVTALYEYIPTKKNERAKESGLRYQSVELTEHAKKSDEILSLKIRYKDPKEDISKLLVFNSQNDKKKLNKTSNNFRFATAVAEYCLLLRDSEEKGNANFDQVLELAKGSRGDDPDGLRAELIRLVESAQILSVENEEKKEAEENKEIPE